MALRNFKINWIPFLFILLFLVSCQNNGSEVLTNKSKTFKIGIIKLGDHKVINAVVNGFNQRIKELLHDQVAIKIADGKFDAATVADLASRLVAGDFDVIVSVTTPATLLTIGANRGTKKQIFTFVSDLEAIGYTGKGSLNNTCGLSDIVNYKKTLELIKVLLPRSQKIGMVVTKNEPNALLIMNEFKKIAPQYGLQIVSAEISEVRDFHFAMKTLSSKVDAFLFGGDNNLAQVLSTIIETARAYKKPIFACDQLSVEQGAIAAYSVDYFKMGERTAELSVFIKAGVKPEDIDVERIVASKLVINRKAAKIFNIKLDKIIKNADEVLN